MIEFDDSNDYYGTMARFFPISDPEIDYVYVKDADSSITWKEKKAIDEWIKSGKGFLVCKVKNEAWPIIAQLWGSKRGIIKNTKEKVEKFLKTNENRWCMDQEFLRDFVWPIAKSDCIRFGDKDEWGKTLPFPDLKEDKGVACGLTVISDKNANIS